jgi:hypothetical protein
VVVSTGKKAGMKSVIEQNCNRSEIPWTIYSIDVASSVFKESRILAEAAQAQGKNK